MNKVSQFFKKFIATRNIPFYVAFGVAVLLFIGGAVATGALAFAGAGVLPLVFTLIGLLAFAGLSLLGYERTGAAAAGVAGFFSLVALVIGVYGYFLDTIQKQAMTGFDIASVEGLPALIACVAILLVGSIACNVFAWLALAKKEQSVKEESAAAAKEEE